MAHDTASSTHLAAPRVLVAGPAGGSARRVAEAVEAHPGLELVQWVEPLDEALGLAETSDCSAVVVVATAEDSVLWRTVMGLARPPRQLPVIVVGPDSLRTAAFLTGAEDWIPHDGGGGVDGTLLERVLHNAVIRRRVAGGLPTHGHLHGLVTGLAHEVNNPLTVIHADLEDACERLDELRETLDDTELDDELADISEMLVEDQKAAQRIGALARALQNLARLADTVPSALHTGPAIRRVLARIRSISPAAPTPRFAGGTEWLVHASVHGFEEAFFGVLLNAIQAQEAAEVDAAVEVTVVATDELVEFTVRDRGTGVRADLEGRVLSPFVTGRPPGEGLGLGLTLAALAVRRAGGDVQVAPRVGGGTEVCLGFLHARARVPMIMDDDEELAAR